MHAGFQSDLTERGGRIERLGADLCCQFHIFQRRQILHEVVELKDKSDIKAAVVRHLPLIHLIDTHSVHFNLAGGTYIHSAEDIENR